MRSYAKIVSCAMNRCKMITTENLVEVVLRYSTNFISGHLFQFIRGWVSE